MSSITPIGTDLATYLSGPVAAALSAVDTQGFPCLARSAGCKVSEDRETLTLFLDQRKSGPLLTAAQARNFLAALFCLPGPEKAVQIKGDQVFVSPLSKAEEAYQLAYRQDWQTHLVSLGYALDFAHAIVDWPVTDLVAIRFRPVAVFEQTPGPLAGTPLFGGLS